MSRALNIRSSIENKSKTQTLPVLTRRCTTSVANRKNAGTIEDLSVIKLKISETELKIRQIKSKTVRMKQEIHDRKAAINKVLSKNNDSKNIKTASESTLSQLKDNVNSLQNTLRAREEELSQLRVNDALYQSNELEVEIRTYYLEHKRLLTQVDAVTKGKDIINNELQKLHNQIDKYKEDQNQMTILQDQIDQLLDKHDAYQKGEHKIIRYQTYKQMQENPQNAAAIEQQLLSEINDLKDSMRQGTEKLRNIEANDEKNMEELQDIIEDQINKIFQAIETMRNPPPPPQQQQQQQQDQNQDNQDQTNQQNHGNRRRRH